MVKEIVKYFVLVVLIFGVLTGILFAFEDGYRIQWMGLVGSVLSVTFILSIRNPYNYIGFILGAVSSLVLTAALWEIDLDGALTYLCIFFPAQLYSFHIWRNLAKIAAREQVQVLSAPRWQTKRERWQTLGAGIVMMAVVGVIVRFLNPDFGFISLLFNALFTTTAVLANVLLIYKLTDSRIYWVAFSTAGMGLSLSLGDNSLYFMMMFLLFTVINIIVLVDWIKATK